MDQVGQTRAGRLGDAAPSSGAGPALPSGGTPADPAALIDQEVSGHRVVIFSKVICPSSRKAKEILGSHRLPPGQMEVVELDQRADGAALQDELKARTGKQTVPVVFLDGQFVGGADDLGQLEASGQLRARLGA